MTKSETEALLATMYQAYANADIAAMAASMSDQLVMHVPGSHPLAGDHAGGDAVWAYLGKVAEISGGVGGFVVRGISGDDDGHAVAILEGTIRDFVRPIVHVWRLLDAQAVEFWEVNFDQEAEDQFWSTALNSTES
jgi:ketosteroid isomerase-like protein